MESIPNTCYVDAKITLWELLVASVTVVVVVLAAVYVLLSNSIKRKYGIVGKHVLVC